MGFLFPILLVLRLFLYNNTLPIRKMNWICQKLCKYFIHGSDSSEKDSKPSRDCLPSQEQEAIIESPSITILVLKLIRRATKEYKP